MTIFNEIKDIHNHFSKNKKYNLNNIILENIKKDELLYISTLYSKLIKLKIMIGYLAII